MRRKIIFSAFLTFLFAAVSYGQGSPNRLIFSHIPDSSGGQIVNVTYTGLENPNVRIFESLVPASSDAECHSSTAFPNPRVLGPNVASLVFDPATSTYKLRWATPKDRKPSCRVLRVGDSIDSADLNVWQSSYGTGGLLAEYPITDARSTPVLGGVTYTFTVTNTSSLGVGPPEKE